MCLMSALDGGKLSFFDKRSLCESRLLSWDGKKLFWVFESTVVVCFCWVIESLFGMPDGGWGERVRDCLL